MPSILSLPPAPELYIPFYEGELISVKASGKEMSGEKGEVLAQSIAELVRRNIRIVLAYGGGAQVSQLYRETYGEDRPMRDGVAVCDGRVLQCAERVHDRLGLELRERLTRLLDCEVDVIDPREVACEYMDFEERGFVGVPVGIENEMHAPVSLIGFNGRVGGQRVNVNADDIARLLAPRMRENFLATETGGVLDRYDPARAGEGTVVPVIFADEILPNGTHPRYAVEGGMKKKLACARAMASHARVVITSGEHIPAEIFSVGGKGTLVVARERISAGAPMEKEKDIVRFVIDGCERIGLFRPRSEAEKRRAIDRHLVLRDHTPLAGCALMEHDDGSVELGTLWGYNGMGVILAQAARGKFHGMSASYRTLFALTSPENEQNALEEDPAYKRFARYGFTFQGRLSDAVAGKRAPAHLRFYDTSVRNPYLFTYARPEGVTP